MVEIVNNIPFGFFIIVGFVIGGIIGILDANNISRNVDKELEKDEFYRKKNSFYEPESNHTSDLRTRI
jgi:hypothetical protein